jgi:protein involved in sex pheromone biosynthesis
MLKRILIGIGIIIGVFLLSLVIFKKNEDQDITYNTNLIQQQILNVGKLVVTEGHLK